MDVATYLGQQAGRFLAEQQAAPSPLQVVAARAKAAMDKEAAAYGAGLRNLIGGIGSKLFGGLGNVAGRGLTGAAQLGWRGTGAAGLGMLGTAYGGMQGYRAYNESGGLGAPPDKDPNTPAWREHYTNALRNHTQALQGMSGEIQTKMDEAIRTNNRPEIDKLQRQMDAGNYGASGWEGSWFNPFRTAPASAHQRRAQQALQAIQGQYRNLEQRGRVQPGDLETLQNLRRQRDSGILLPHQQRNVGSRITHLERLFNAPSGGESPEAAQFRGSVEPAVSTADFPFHLRQSPAAATPGSGGGNLWAGAQPHGNIDFGQTVPGPRQYFP
jgi:hypothetical protein